MIGTMTQISGKRVLRGDDRETRGSKDGGRGYIQGDFYKRPVVGKPFRMWASNGEQMRMVETSHVVEITHNNMRFIRFKVKDGAEFELKDIQEGGSSIMVGMEV